MAGIQAAATRAGFNLRARPALRNQMKGQSDQGVDGLVPEATGYTIKREGKFSWCVGFTVNTYGEISEHPNRKLFMAIQAAAQSVEYRDSAAILVPSDVKKTCVGMT